MSPRSNDCAVIVGAGLGGWTVCRELRALGFDGAITLVGDEARPPYDRPPLTKRFLSSEGFDPVLTTPSELDALAVRPRLGDPVVEIGDGRVVLASGERLPATQVVVATGSRARRLPWSVDTPRDDVRAIRSLDDALAFKEALGRIEGRSGRLVVVGGGYLGLEAASAARARGVAVTVVEAQDELLAATLGHEVGGRLRALHEADGVEFVLGAEATGLDGPAGRPTLRLRDGSAHRADLVLEALGAVPGDALLGGTGRGVVCTADGRVVGRDGTWAVGDIAAWQDPVTGRHVRREHWASAVDQGTRVAAGILDLDTTSVPLAEPPYFWSDQAGVKLQVVGRPELATQRAWRELDGHPPATVLDYRRGDVLVGAAVVGAPRLLRRIKTEIAEAEARLSREMEIDE